MAHPLTNTLFVYLRWLEGVLMHINDNVCVCFQSLKLAASSITISHLLQEDYCDQSKTAPGTEGVCPWVCVCLLAAIRPHLWSASVQELLTCAAIFQDSWTWLPFRFSSDRLLKEKKKNPQRTVIWLKDKNRELHIITKPNPCSSQL